VGTNISEEYTASIISPVPPKCWYPPTISNGVTAKKTTMDMFKKYLNTLDVSENRKDFGKGK
jgi:hypothetical protein